MRAERGRARRHPLVAGFVVAYLAAGGMTVALGDRATSGSWLAVHLVLFGAATNAIVVWSEHFAAVLLRAAPVSERTATAGRWHSISEPWPCSAACTRAARCSPWPVPGWSVHSCRPHTAASWMLGAGLGWLAFSVVVDLVELAGSPQVVDLDQRIDRLVPAVVVGFAIQVLTGALTYLLPVVFGRGAYGNRKLTGVLEAAWPLRVAAVNLGVVLLVARSSGGWVARAG